MTLYDKLKFSFKFLGGVISYITLIYEFLNLSKSIFTSKVLYNSYEAFIILRVAIIMLISIFLYYRNFYKHPVIIPNEATMRPEFLDARKQELKERGSLFYLSLPLMQWLGLYRLYAVKDFKYLLTVNYIVEFLF
jgi:hypothetical protein